MKTPFPLLGLALLFWGWQTGMVVWAVVLAVLMEGSRLVRWRWNLSAADYRSIWNLCAILFVAAVVYVFFARDGAEAMGNLFQTHSLGVRADSLKQMSGTALVFVQWLPIIFAPLALAQFYGAADRIPLRAFSLLVRVQERKEAQFRGRAARREANLTWPYFLAVLGSASATNTNPLWFFPALASLLAFALWHERPRRYRAGTWVGMMIVAVAIAFGAQLGFIQLQQRLDAWQNQMLNQFGRREFDQTQSRTALGNVGRLKLSGRIVMRVLPTSRPPSLLREASFNLYRSPIWTGDEKEFSLVTPTVDSGDWLLRTNTGPNEAVITISRYTTDGHTALALPEGAVVIREPSADAMQTNRFGAAQMVGGLNLANYIVETVEDGGFDAAPEAADRELPAVSDGDAAALSRVAEELQLASLPPDAAVEAVGRFFARNFSYSTWLGPFESREEARSPLATFLERTRSGHCEYYATATTLLLRHAGIPTRYAIGYSIDAAANRLIPVRERDAHAWTLAFLDGRWQTIDFTPSGWRSVEEQRAGFFQPVSDWFSNRWHDFNQWRQGGDLPRGYIFAISMVMLAFLAWRQVAGRKWRRSGRKDAAAVALPDRLGLDSEFYRVCALLDQSIARRPEHEPLAHWLARLTGLGSEQRERVERVLELHYRHRFDPSGVTPRERDELRRTSTELLGQLEAKARAAGG